MKKVAGNTMMKQIALMIMSVDGRGIIHVMNRVAGIMITKLHVRQVDVIGRHLAGARQRPEPGSAGITGNKPLVMATATASGRKTHGARKGDRGIIIMRRAARQLTLHGSQRAVGAMNQKMFNAGIMISMRQAVQML